MGVRGKYDVLLGDLREDDSIIQKGITIIDTYQLQLSDANKYLSFNSSTNKNITIPKNIFSEGDIIYIEQTGIGVFTIVGYDVNITVNGNKKSGGQYSVVGIFYKDASINANVCTVIGGVA